MSDLTPLAKRLTDRAFDHLEGVARDRGEPGFEYVDIQHAVAAVLRELVACDVYRGEADYEKVAAGGQEVGRRVAPPGRAEEVDAVSDDSVWPVPFKDLVTASAQEMLMFMPGVQRITRLAIEAERTVQHGRALGLTEDQVAEVVRVHRESPWTWGQLRDVLSKLAMGMEWKP